MPKNELVQVTCQLVLLLKNRPIQVWDTAEEQSCADGQQQLTTAAGHRCDEETIQVQPGALSRLRVCTHSCNDRAFA